MVMVSEEAKLQRIEGRELTGQRVELSLQSGLTGIFQSRFVDCEFVLKPKGLPAFRGGARFTVSRARFERCSFHATARVHALTFDTDVQLEACTFTGGPYTSPVFGDDGLLRPNDPSWQGSWIRNCDLSGAQLRDARFYNTPVESLVLPGWPHIVVAGGPGVGLQLLAAVEASDWRDPECKRAIGSIARAAHDPDVPLVYVTHAEVLMGRDEARLDLFREELLHLRHPSIHI
jgi:hypothetical protein